MCTAAGFLRFCLVLLTVACLRAEMARASPSAADAAPAGVSMGEPATLVIWNRPVVTLRATVDAVTPQQRVARIHRRVATLPPSADHAVSVSPAQVGALHGYWIAADGRMLLALLPEDVDPEEGQTLQQLAEATGKQLQIVLQARAEQHRLPRLLRAGVLSLAATVLFIATLWGIFRLRRRALGTARASAGERPIAIRGINFRPYMRAVEEGVIKLTAIGCSLFAGYLWLAFVLLQLPYSEPWGQGLNEWLRDLFTGLGRGALEALPGFFTVVVIFLATRLVVQAVNRFFTSVERGWLRVNWLDLETARATRRLAVVLIWIFALTVAYPYIPGSDSNAFKGISVFVGLMISLGSAGFVNQVMSGLVIVYSRALRTGDYVQVGDSEGTISEVGVLSTKMQTPTRQEVTIPNALLVSAKVVNYSRLADAAHGSIIGTTLTIGYDTPWRQVHAMLLLAASRTAGVRTDPAPRVIQRALSDFYVEYQLLISIDQPQRQRQVLSDLHAHVQDVFNEHGVQIMSPHFVAQPADKVWTPPSLWHAAPAAAARQEAKPAAPAAAAEPPSAATA